MRSVSGTGNRQWLEDGENYVVRSLITQTLLVTLFAHIVPAHGTCDKKSAACMREIKSA